MVHHFQFLTKCYGFSTAVVATAAPTLNAWWYAFLGDFHHSSPCKSVNFTMNALLKQVHLPRSCSSVFTQTRELGDMPPQDPHELRGYGCPLSRKRSRQLAGGVHVGAGIS